MQFNVREAVAERVTNSHQLLVGAVRDVVAAGVKALARSAADGRLHKSA
jgi:hypothetical protein